MKCKVYYTSSRNVAEMLAGVIAQTAGVPAERLFPAFLPDGVDLMFLGCDRSHADDVVLEFIDSMKPERVKYAALFNANSKLSLRALEQLRTSLTERGVIVLETTLLCQSRPFQKELPDFDRTAAVDFATACVRETRRHCNPRRPAAPKTSLPPERRI